MEVSEGRGVADEGGGEAAGGGLAEDGGDEGDLSEVEFVVVVGAGGGEEGDGEAGGGVEVGDLGRHFERWC